jgi:TP901 family phage tail tape measure protein
MAQKELSLKLNFEPEVNQAKAQAAGDKLNKAFAGVTVEPEIKQSGKFDSSLKSMTKRTETEFKNSGTRSGKEFGNAFNKGIEPELKKSQGLLGNFGKGIKSAFADGQKQAAKGAGIFGTLASSVGQLVSPIGLATAAFGLFASTATAAFTEFRALDKEVQNIGTLGVENFREFAGLATDLSRSVPESASKIAGATYQAISAGIKGSNQEIIDFVGQASRVAVAGLSTTEEAVNGLTSVLNSYKLGVNDTQKVSDTFFAAIKLGKTTFNELNGAVATVVPTASAAGIGFDEIAASIAQMTALGVPTAQASTQLRSAMVELQKPTGELAKFMDSLGLSTKDIQGKLKNQGLIATLQELEGEATKSGKSFNLMFGSQEAGSAAALLTGENAKRASETLAGVRKEIESGVSTKAYEEAAKGIDVQLKIIGNNVQAGFNDAFEAIKPAAEKGLQFIIGVFAGWWEYFKAGFIEPLKGVWESVMDQIYPIKELFKEQASKSGTKKQT